MNDNQTDPQIAGTAGTPTIQVVCLSQRENGPALLAADRIHGEQQRGMCCHQRDPKGRAADPN
jgi:hypothetical protein